MESPVHIDFQGMNPSELLRDRVLKHVAGLEQRFGRITACRVAIKAPSEHHHSGGLYEINIRLSLPQGREVDVGRTATADERRADLDFAVNDAFKRARRRLSLLVRPPPSPDHLHDPAGTTPDPENRIEPRTTYF